MEYKTFTSESVSKGHPDKLADQISDAILDAIIAQCPRSRVACETLVKTGLVVIAGEIKTDCYVNVEEIARRVIKEAGYTDRKYGMDGDACGVINALGEQSSELSDAVDGDREKGTGAGDQGMMFGYATNESEGEDEDLLPSIFMPLPIAFAHRLVKRQAEVRCGELNWLGPDAKSQVTVRYEDGKPVAVDAIVLSTQHDEGRKTDVEEAVRAEIIANVIPDRFLHKNTKYHINPSGKFVKGGPHADCGLTGRKIIVDTYGGMARHGGGAFSGKDPSKVDRSAAYAARYVAKNLVAAGLADRCEVQLSYAIGKIKPVSIAVNTFGTNKIDEQTMEALIKEHFNLTPDGIIEMLQLNNPIYRPTATYGHFGRDDCDFSWERPDKKDALMHAA